MSPSMSALAPKTFDLGAMDSLAFHLPHLPLADLISHRNESEDKGLSNSIWKRLHRSGSQEQAGNLKARFQ
jgi:hypothetical protein